MSSSTPTKSCAAHWQECEKGLYGDRNRNGEREGRTKGNIRVRKGTIGNERERRQVRQAMAESYGWGRLLAASRSLQTPHRSGENPRPDIVLNNARGENGLGWHVSRNVQCRNALSMATQHQRTTNIILAPVHRRETPGERGGPARSQGKFPSGPFPPTTNDLAPIRHNPGRSRTSGYCCPPHPESTIPHTPITYRSHPILTSVAPSLCSSPTPGNSIIALCSSCSSSAREFAWCCAWSSRA